MKNRILQTMLIGFFCLNAFSAFAENYYYETVSGVTGWRGGLTAPNSVLATDHVFINANLTYNFTASAGTIAVGTGSTLTMSGVFTNYGTLTNSGIIIGASNSSLIDNQTGATLFNSGTVSNMSITNNGTFSNAGTYNMNQTGGALTLNTTSSLPSGINWTTGTIYIGASGVVTIGGSFAVPLNCTFQVNTGGSLTLSAFTNNGNFIVNGTVALRSVFTNAVSGTLTINGIFRVEYATDPNDDARLSNFGTLDVPLGGTLRIGDPVYVIFCAVRNETGGITNIYGNVLNHFFWYNQAGSTLNIYSGGRFESPNSAQGSVGNAGTINIFSGGLFSYHCVFDNTGLYNFRNPNLPQTESVLGTLNLSSGGIIDVNRSDFFNIGGNFNWVSGGTVNLIRRTVITSGRELTLVAGQILNILPTGSLEINSGATLNNNTTVNLNGGLLKVGTGSVVNNAATINVNTEGVLSLFNSMTSNTGTINLTGTGFVTIDADNVQLPSNLNWVGSVNVSNGVTYTLTSNVTMPANAFFRVGLAAGMVINSGVTFTENGFVAIGGTFRNEGICNINGLGNTGSFFVDNIQNNTTSFTNNGTMNVSGYFSHNAFSFANTGTINITYSLLAKNTINNTGIININTNGSFELDYANCTLPAGTLNWNTGGIIAIGSHGTFSLTTDLTIASGRTLTVFGSMTIGSGVTLTNNAVFTFEDGRVTNNGTFINNQVTRSNRGLVGSTNTDLFLNNGTFKGNGNFSTGQFDNRGILAPGLSPGCLYFINSVVNHYAATNIEINGATTACSDFDQVVQTGIVKVGGVLNVSFGYTPAMGSTFQIFRSSNNAGMTGSFTTINVTPNTIPVVYDPATGNLIVAEPCTQPQNIVTTAIFQNRAQFSWDANGSAASFQVQYRNVTNNGSVQTLTVTTPSVEIPNLLPSTTYEWQVRTNCSANVTSDWTTMRQFTTLAPPNCPAMYAPGADNVRMTTATIGWYVTDPLLNYKIRYKKISETTWTDLTAFDTYLINITNLDAGTDYEVQVTKSCDGTTFADWSPSGYFKTTFGTKQNGNWNDPNTWASNQIPPTNNSPTFIGHTVTVNVANAICGALTVENGTLNVPTGGVLTIGRINLANHTGAKDNAQFTNGILNVTGGTLNIGGQLNINASSTFNLSLGTILIHFQGLGSFQGFLPSIPTLFIDDNATTNIQGGTIHIYSPSLGNQGLTIAANKNLGNFTSCVGATVILESDGGFSDDFYLGGDDAFTGIAYHPNFYNLILRGAKTTTMSGITVRNELTVDAATLTITSASTFGHLTQLNSPTITGSYTQTGVCVLPGFQSITSGAWNATSTWSSNTIPTATDDVTIMPTHTVTIPTTGTSVCNNLTVNGTISNTANGGFLKCSGNMTLSSTGVYDGGSYIIPPTGAAIYTGGGVLAIAANKATPGNSTGASASPANNKTLTVNGGNFTGFIILAGRLFATNNATVNLKGGDYIGWSETPQYIVEADNTSTVTIAGGTYLLRSNGSQPHFSPNVVLTSATPTCPSGATFNNINGGGDYVFGSDATDQTMNTFYTANGGALNSVEFKRMKVNSLTFYTSGSNSKTITSNNSKFNSMSIFGNLTTLRGSFQLVNSCSGGNAYFSCANTVSVDNTFGLNINTTDSAIIDLSTFATNQTFNLLGTFNVQNGITVVKGGTLDLRNAIVTGLSPTHFFVTKPNFNNTKMGSVILPGISTTPSTFNLGLAIPNGANPPTNIYAPLSIVSTVPTSGSSANVSISLQTLTAATNYTAPQIQWNITPLGASASLNITFTWPALAEPTSFANSRNLARIFHFNGTTWDELPSTGLTTITNPDGSLSYSLTTNGVTQFSPFMVGILSSVLSAELVDFKAKNNGNKAELNWQTASEVNVKNFAIEKSLDGKVFDKIAETKANNTPSVYQAFDNDFTASAYYRLKINDLDGSSRFSKIVYLDKNNDKGIKISRNTEGSIFVETDDKIELITVTNTIGQVVKTTKDKLLLINDLNAGIYIVSVKTDKGFLSQKFFKD